MAIAHPAPAPAPDRASVPVPAIVSAVTATPEGPTPIDAGRWRLSRHVCIRPQGDAFVVESAVTGDAFPLSSPSVFRILLALARPVAGIDLLSAVDEGQRGAIVRFLERCRDGGVLVAVDEAGASEAEDRGALASWEFHDLLFHAASRRGRTRRPLGATWPLAGRVDPEPALRPESSRVSIFLPRPEVQGDAPSFDAVLEARRTRYGTDPLSLAELGEFLYRACRFTSVEGERGEQEVRRVYPSGGGLHSLETYVTAWACDGLARGLYRYDARGHALVPVRAMDTEVEGLLADARAATGRLDGHPPVLLTLATRFRRVSYKYQGLAYRLVLQEVGAAYQTMYLVATSMGLAPCALGGGDLERFARAAGVDPHREAAVGDFILAGAPRPAPAG